MKGYLVMCETDDLQSDFAGQKWPVKVFMEEEKASQFVHKMSVSYDGTSDIDKYWTYREIEVITK